jgi:hypothetical protein
MTGNITSRVLGVLSYFIKPKKSIHYSDLPYFTNFCGPPVFLMLHLVPGIHKKEKFCGH